LDINPAGFAVWRSEVRNMASRDDDHLSSGDRARTHGTASSQSRYASASSNASSTNLQHHRVQNARSNRAKTHDTHQSGSEGAAGDLLQEKLREMKAARLHDRRKSRDLSGLHDSQRGTQSSPAGPRRTGRDPDSDALSSTDRKEDRPTGKKGMGVKAMEDVRPLCLLYLDVNVTLTSCSSEGLCFT